MSKNPHAHHHLDPAQVIKRVFDEQNDAYRVHIDELSFSLSADQGDSVLAKPLSLSQKISVNDSLSGDLLAPINVVGMKTFQVFVNGSDDVESLSPCIVYLSPSDSDDVWFPLVSVNASPGSSMAAPIQAVVIISIVTIFASLRHSGCF